MQSPCDDDEDRPSSSRGRSMAAKTNDDGAGRTNGRSSRAITMDECGTNAAAPVVVFSRVAANSAARSPARATVPVVVVVMVSMCDV